ncbi:unnamed protein product [Closterium sp. Yama58-4]|nr:unnamed protein product [Closterium sp. Yama58-4]
MSNQLSIIAGRRSIGVTLPSCLKSLNFLISCPDLDAIFSSASPFTALEELLITNCSGLESLPNGIEDLLPCLRKLAIRDCHHFTHLNESFTSLSCLETLVVSFCDAFTLPNNFGRLPALKLLVLEALSLASLPPSFCHLTSLEALFILDCGELSQLPEGLCRLTALKALCIALSLKVELTENVGALPSLQALRLHECPHPCPAFFTNLSSLTSLKLDDCFPVGLPRQMLPSSLFQLAGLKMVKLLQLRVLKLNCVGVRCGPAMSSMLTCLQQMREQVEWLEQQGGGPELPIPLSSLPRLRSLFSEQLELLQPLEQLQQVKQLEHLEMRLGGESRELPVTLTFLPRLRSLLIEAPGISRLPVNMAAALPQLQQLELHSWSPEELPGSILKLTSLMSLTVEAPQLVALPQGMARLSRLCKLELIRCNALQHLPECLSRLHQLVLRDTSIRSVPAKLVQVIEEQ